MGKFDISSPIHIDSNQRRKLSALLLEMEKTTKAELPKIIRNVGRDFCKSAIAVTPMVKKVIKQRIFVVRDKAGNVVLRNGKPIYYRAKKAMSVKPKGRGFAKAGWVWAMRNLGAIPVAGVAAFTREGALKLGHFVDGRKQKNPFIEIGNRIPYIEELDRGSKDNPAYHIMSKSISKTIIKTEENLEKAVKIYERRWRRVR